MKRFISLTVMLAMASVASAENEHKQSKDLPNGSSNALVDVIIQFNITGSKGIDSHLKDIEEMLERFGQQQGQNNQQQGRDRRIVNSIQAIHVKVPVAMLPWLRAIPAVRYVSLNRPATKFLDLSTSAVSASVAWQAG